MFDVSNQRTVSYQSNRYSYIRLFEQLYIYYIYTGVTMSFVDKLEHSVLAQLNGSYKDHNPLIKLSVNMRKHYLFTIYLKRLHIIIDIHLKSF